VPRVTVRNASTETLRETLETELGRWGQSGFFPIGVAVRAAGTNDATCRVRLSGTPVVAAGA
jgi:hypothetical protein